jgi:hypothetical protein
VMAVGAWMPVAAANVFCVVSVFADGSTAGGSSSNALAIAALIVSISTAVIALGGLSWQLFLYWLSGARLKVSLVFGYLGADGTDRRYATARASRKPPSWSANFCGHVSDLGIEYAEVRVTNIGRAPVSVEDICFDLGRCSRWSLKRNSITPKNFYDPRRAKHADDRQIDPTAQHCLEPGANITVAFNLWPVMAEDKLGSRVGPVTIRGSATAVGRRRTRSKRRYAWKLPKGATTRFSDRPPTPELLVYRQLWNHSYNEAIRDALLNEHPEIINRLQLGDRPPQIEAYLNTLISDPEQALLISMIAHQVYSIYHRDMAPGTPRGSRLRRFGRRIDAWAAAKTAEWRRLENGEQ